MIKDETLAEFFLRTGLGPEKQQERLQERIKVLKKELKDLREELNVDVRVGAGKYYS